MRSRASLIMDDMLLGSGLSTSTNRKMTPPQGSGIGYDYRLRKEGRESSGKW
jgi:hypothetical protein